ncbi:hypothetical protein Rhe02_39100 [Rhizocola hellebori]|uniref:Uncharacterized protein n=1 Tax=Rhizocola hellebori TaxID=1392758 RepID=A0A8J3Q9V8_9ACTN|nr:hypothetical protein Rhe02_39100 [Rhizocola hellebori]
MITLQEAYDRWNVCNSFEWYRKRAASGRPVFGDVGASKIGGRWMVDEALLDHAIVAREAAKEERRRRGADYQAHILTGEDGDTIRTDWGGYRRAAGFHFVWDDQRVAMRHSDGVWVCDQCFKAASSEYGREECHRCRDWSPCRGDCTLSKIYCAGCGTSKTM